MRKYLQVLFALALTGASCRDAGPAYRPAGQRGMAQARRVAILPFPGGEWYYDQFYYLASTELWPGRTVPKEEAAAALRDAGYEVRASILPKNQARAVAAALGADTVVAGYRDPRGVLRVRVSDTATGTAWARAKRVDNLEDLRVFVLEIRRNLNGSDGSIHGRRAAPRRQAPAKPRPSRPGGSGSAQPGPSGSTQSGAGVAGSTRTEPAAGGSTGAPAAAGTTAPPEEEGGSGAAGGSGEGLSGSAGN